MKRFFDLLISLTLLLALSTPLLAVMILVFFTSKGPIFHWSKRVGRANVIFHMPKFRTMIIDVPDVATHLLENPSSYYTPVGEFLRKYSIDELPQIYSIIIGHMSLVGPRPALYNQEDLISMRTKEGIDSLLPGVTGLAQISGRDGLSIEKKVEIDKDYLNHKSFLFDLHIIWLTVIKVLKREDISH